MLDHRAHAQLTQIIVRGFSVMITKNPLAVDFLVENSASLEEVTTWICARGNSYRATVTNVYADTACSLALLPSELTSPVHHLPLHYETVRSLFITGTTPITAPQPGTLKFILFIRSQIFRQQLSAHQPRALFLFPHQVSVAPQPALQGRAWFQ